MYFNPIFNFKTSEYKHFSTKTDKFSIALPQPLVITQTDLLPGFAWEVPINLHQLL